MHIQLTRRRILAYSAAILVVAASGFRPAFAQASGANAFVKKFADDPGGDHQTAPNPPRRKRPHSGR